MPNLFFRGQRELSTGLQFQQKDQNHMAGNLCTITGHIYCEMLLESQYNQVHIKLFPLSS